MKRYFIVITEKFFGVFAESARSYPDFFIENIQQVKIVEERNLDKFLIHELGRNTLIKVQFDQFRSIGHVFLR